jgi:hypothetical protein
MNSRAMSGAAIAVAIAGLSFSVPVVAQTAPSSTQGAPSFGQALGNETLDGVVVRFVPGAYDFGLRDDHGYLDTVRLHDRTIIFPIGLSMVPGMRVHVLGFNGGSAFAANEIEWADPALPVLEVPAWYREWDGTRQSTGPPGFRNPPAPRFVNPPAPP